MRSIAEKIHRSREEKSIGSAFSEHLFVERKTKIVHVLFANNVYMYKWKRYFALESGKFVWLCKVKRVPVAHVQRYIRTKKMLCVHMENVRETKKVGVSLTKYFIIANSSRMKLCNKLCWVFFGFSSSSSPLFFFFIYSSNTTKCIVKWWRWWWWVLTPMKSVFETCGARENCCTILLLFIGAMIRMISSCFRCGGDWSDVRN